MKTAILSIEPRDKKEKGIVGGHNNFHRSLDKAVSQGEDAGTLENTGSERVSGGEAKTRENKSRQSVSQTLMNR
ncbi:hypothetical protein E2C01_091991 [Portunus trituberculatus]|uniref:Uncharacterized protein n=1 Tax=Portunus trituberculatus TaxID=210409 RepID=A0A5B7JQV4_PORTR|nr:hypothetical protein [Portunus trituberculatus]